MAKPKLYPKKFRQKLERMREQREERPQRKHPSEMTFDELAHEATNTLWREFIPKDSIALMYAKLDAEHMRMTMNYHFDMPRRPCYVTAMAPWETHLPEPSPAPASE